jgi:3-deoxy-D-manno-octulosonate 8-phosphate phosphatase (KDO 8-P phosphatase)
LDIPLAIITGEDTEIVRRRMQKLGVPGLHMGVKDKVGVAESICSQAGISLSQVAYIGDDLNDMALLKAVGLSAVPANAPAYIQQIAEWVIPVKGGEGAFRAFVEKYLTEEGLMGKALDAYHVHTSGFRQ